MGNDSDKAIIDSWRKNAAAWIKAIAQENIASRTEVTNDAILDAVLCCNPANLLDIGCGEGWLIREISKYGTDCLGIDAISEFSTHVENSGGRFRLLTYEEYGAESFDTKYDVIVCNFSLLGKESVENVITESAEILNSHGALIIQTIHPEEAGSEEGYMDGWRTGSWQGFSDDFVDPAPWYFRTIKSWQSLFTGAGFTRLKITEPRHPKAGNRLSIIFEARM